MTSKPLSLSPQSVVERSDRVVTCDLDDEMVLLSLQTEKYYGLDPVGARVWALLEQPRRLDELGELLLSEFAVEQQRLDEDLARLCGELLAEELISAR